MNWDRLKIVTPPSGSILDLDTVKTHLRVISDADDDYIQTLIDTATAFIEGPHGCGIALLTQTWKMALDFFPVLDLSVPLGPVQSIDSIHFIDMGNQTQLLDASAYVVDLVSDPPRVRPVYGTIWPVSLPTLSAVTVQFTCGYGATAASVPADIKHAAMLLIGHWYENRSAVVGIDSRDTPQDMPFAVEAILGKYRTVAFA